MSEQFTITYEEVESGYDEYGNTIYEDDDGYYTLDVFQEKQYKKLENKNIGGNNNMNDGGLKYTITRSVSFNFNKSEFTVENISEQDFEQVKNWCDITQKEEYKRLQLDFPIIDTKPTNNNYNTNNQPNYNNNNNNSNNYNNNQSSNSIPCKCGGQMVASGKRTRDGSRGEYKCQCGQFKWQ